MGPPLPGFRGASLCHITRTGVPPSGIQALKLESVAQCGAQAGEAMSQSEARLSLSGLGAALSHTA